MPDWAREVRTRLSSLRLSPTHTHAGPEIGPPEMYKALLGRSDHEWDREYTSRTTTALINAVRAARDTLEPARIAFGTGVSSTCAAVRQSSPGGPALLSWTAR